MAPPADEDDFRGSASVGHRTEFAVECVDPAHALLHAEQRIKEALQRHSVVLNLSNLGLSQLPDSLARLKDLQVLYARNNHLNSFPDLLTRLVQLRAVDLVGNHLASLPESISELTRLETLDVSRNRLRDLPEATGSLTRLQVLYAHENQLQEVSDGLGRLTALRDLDLGNNRLAYLPESLGSLGQVVEINVSGNRLSSLPANMGRLRELRHLSLAQNQVSFLPEWIERLWQLRNLNLSANRLETLPESLTRLAQLETLDVSHNQLESLPESIRKLTSLKQLFLHGNPDLRVPAEVLGRPRQECIRGRIASSPSSILDYYFGTRGSEGQSLRELKLLVVGRGGAGKTSLIRRLRGAPLNRDERETHGIVISRLRLSCGDGPVRARVWDFGGQHVLHAMHEFFLTARSLYLLVLGERDELAERDAIYWLQLIRAYAGPAPVVVALNKSGGRPREMDRATLERNYGPILAWVPTECDQSHPDSAGSIAMLGQALNDAADSMDQVRDHFPAKWWAIKESLEGMRAPYLDYDGFRAQCRAHGEGTESQQDILAARLNELGIAINYAADERLHDTTVLRPDWLANGIYAILRANDPQHAAPLAASAMLTAEMLGPIYAAAQQLGMLAAAEYPQNKWPFLIRLMARFQLAYPVDEGGNELLVPGLLPLESPAESDEPGDSGRQRLRYEFAVVPSPLLPRLLVRCFSLIDGNRRWRRGAVFRFGSARARVWGTQDERWLRVTAYVVSGSVDGFADGNRDRDDLLAMIRSTIATLLAEYRDLRVVEQWEHEGEWVPRKTLERMGVLPREELEGRTP